MLWRCLLTVTPAVLLGCGQGGGPPAAPRPEVKGMERGGEARNPITVEVPGHGTALPYPFSGTNAPGLDRAFAGLGPSQRLEFRLSMPANAAVTIIGDARIESGAATISTQTGFIDILPMFGVRVRDGNGRTIASGKQPILDKDCPTDLGLWLYPGLASRDKSNATNMCEFGSGTVVADTKGEDIDYDATKQPIPSEIVGARCYATLRVSTTSDFKGSIANWRVMRTAK